MPPSRVVEDESLPEEPPPSYEETLSNPSSSTTLAAGPSRPFQPDVPSHAPPTNLPAPQFPFWNGSQLTPEQTGFNPGSAPRPGTQYHAPGAQNYAGVPTSMGWAAVAQQAHSPAPPRHHGSAPPPVPPRHASSASVSSQRTTSPAAQGQQRIAYTPSDRPTPGQPLLRGNRILVYPVGVWCTKCGNTGYKAFDPGHPCRKCWDNYGRKYNSALRLSIDPYNPPENWQRPLQAFASPTQSFTNPAGQKMRVWSGPMTMPSNALVVQPGDPRIGGWLCPECGGSGDVPGLFFIDRAQCWRCRGAGRVF